MGFFEWFMDQGQARRGEVRRVAEARLRSSRRASRQRGRLGKRVQELSKDVRELEAVIDVLVGALERQGVLREDVVREVAEERRAAEASPDQRDQ